MIIDTLYHFSGPAASFTGAFMDAVVEQHIRTSAACGWRGPREGPRPRHVTGG